MSNKRLTGSQAKEFRSAVAKLKAQGLVSKRIDARSQKPTRYMQGQVKKYQDVLEGKAKAVKLPKRSDAKAYAETLRTKGRTVVVPVSSKTERVQYDKKSGEIYSNVQENGMKFRKTLRTRQLDIYDINTYPRGDNIKYRMPFGNGARFTFDTPEDLFAFMFQYESKPKNPFRDWQKYVEILSISRDTNSSDLDDEGEI